MDTNAIYKLIVPALIGLLSWLIKDFIFGLISKRNAEWEYRLKEIWSPLFYWSGAVMFDEEKKGWDKHGMKEMETILTKSAHLLPSEHYYTLVKLLEMETGQPTKRITIDQIIKTRDYIYKQIELLNYLLHRRSIIDALDSTDILSPYKTALRFLSFIAFHVMIWACIVLIIFALYSLYVDNYYWILWLLAISFTIVMTVNVLKHVKIHREVKKRLKDS